MTETTDPTFYRTPGDAIAAAPEALAYVAAYDPKGVAKDAIAVLDCDATSATYGKPVGWAALTATRGRAAWRCSITTRLTWWARGRSTAAISFSPTTCGGTSTTTP